MNRFKSIVLGGLLSTISVAAIAQNAHAASLPQRDLHTGQVVAFDEHDRIRAERERQIREQQFRAQRERQIRDQQIRAQRDRQLRDQRLRAERIRREREHRGQYPYNR